MIYLLCGGNQFAIEERVSELKAEFRRAGGDNITSLSLTDMSRAELMGYLTSVSLLSSQELLIWWGATDDAAAWQELENVLPNIPEAKTVILVADKATAAVKNMSATRTYRKIVAQGHKERYEVLKPYELQHWLPGEAKKRGVKLDAAASRRLLQLTSGSADQQSRIAVALRLLALLPQPVTAAEIDKYVAPDAQSAAFDIMGAWARGDRKTARILLKRQKSLGDDPNQIIGVLTSQLINLAVVIFGADTEINPYGKAHAEELARSIGNQRKQLTWLRQAAKRIVAADALVKRSSGDEAWGHLADAILSSS